MAKFKRWRTADGRDLLPSQMGTGHLVNALAFIKRKVFAAQVAAGASLQDADIEALTTMLYPIYPELVKELEKRMRKEREKSGTDLTVKKPRKLTFDKGV